jgi:signal transduction protein with GAF and PtsI domain
VKLGLRKPLLDQAQLATSRARFISVSGGVIGVITGCLLGMTVLLFKDLDAADREKEETRKEELRDTVALEVRETIGAERATLWVLEEGSEGECPCLVGKMLETGTLLRLPISNGIAGEAARTQKTINVVNAQVHERFERTVGQNEGFVVKQNLAVPIVSTISGKTLGVVQLLNKLSQEEERFTEADIRDIERIASFLHYELETEDLGFAQALGVLAKQRAERNLTKVH